MSKCKKGCHVRTQIPISTYTFKWSIEHFSKLLVNHEIQSSDFYPCGSGVRWYSVLKKSSSYLTWVMCNPTKQNVSVEHEISVVDSSGKLWIKKKRHEIYDTEQISMAFEQSVQSSNVTAGQTRQRGFRAAPVLERRPSYENIAHCVLIGSSDTINTNDMYHLTKDIVTFTCFMTFSGPDIETQTFELKSEEVDDSKNLLKLSTDLKTMYDISLYTDVCLQIGTDSLRVHKALICGRSPVFAKMFDHNLEEKETNVIEIEDLEIQVLKDFISYLYTALVPNEDFDSVLALYYAADKYDVSDLRKFCGELLLSKLSIDNACLVLALAERHSDQTLKDSVMNFVDINLEPVLATNEWTNLVKKDIKLAAEVMLTRSKAKIDVKSDVDAAKIA